MAQGEISMEVREPRTHSSGHVEYEVCCSLLERLPGQPSALAVRWSVWHRYSSFSTLDTVLRRGFGSAFEGIELPPKQWLGTGDPEFITRRCRALHAYMQCIQRRCHGVTRFDTHQGSAELASFLQWPQRVELSMLPDSVKAAVRGAKEGGAGAEGSEGGGGSGGSGSGSSGSSSGGAAAAADPAATRAAAIAARRAQAGAAASDRVKARSAIATSSAAPSAQRLAVDSAALQHYTAGAAGGGASAHFTVGAAAGAASTPHSLLADAPPAPSPAPRTPLTYTPPPSATRAAAPTPASAPPAQRSAATAAAVQQQPPPQPAAAASPASAAPRPPPPPPPSSIPAEVATPDAGRASLLNAIGGGGFKLKKAVTVDKSGPKL